MLASRKVGAVLGSRALHCSLLGKAWCKVYCGHNVILETRRKLSRDHHHMMQQIPDVAGFFFFEIRAAKRPSHENRYLLQRIFHNDTGFNFGALQYVLFFYCITFERIRAKNNTIPAAAF